MPTDDLYTSVRWSLSLAALCLKPVALHANSFDMILDALVPVELVAAVTGGQDASSGDTVDL